MIALRSESYEIMRQEIDKLIESERNVMATMEGYYETRVRDTIRQISR